MQPAGESRVAHIRRVPLADFTQRQDLPVSLPGSDQPVDKLAGIGAEVA